MYYFGNNHSIKQLSNYSKIEMSGTFEWTMSFKQIQTAVQSSKELALVVNALQRERDRVVLNINNVGSNSRTLLKQSYIKTDQVFENIVHWAVERDKKNKQQYTTKVNKFSLFVRRVSCNAAKNLFCYEGAVFFSTLNNTVKTIQSYREFKDKCKTCFNHVV